MTAALDPTALRILPELEPSAPGSDGPAGDGDEGGLYGGSGGGSSAGTTTNGTAAGGGTTSSSGGCSGCGGGTASAPVPVASEGLAPSAGITLDADGSPVEDAAACFADLFADLRAAWTARSWAMAGDAFRGLSTTCLLTLALAAVLAAWAGRELGG